MSVCSVCGKEIPKTGKRGRPAKICAECKASVTKGTGEPVEYKTVVVVHSENLDDLDDF